MALPQRVVDEFKKRKLRDSAKAKRFSRKALLRKIAKLDPPPVFHTKPFTHQLVCFLLGTKYSGYLDLLDMGLGKSKLILDLLAWRIARKDARRGVVVVPGISNVAGWIDEVSTHQPGLRVLGLTPDIKGEERERVVHAGEYDLLVLTYAALQRLLCRAKKAKGRKKAQGIEPHLPSIRKFAKLFDFINYDESTALMNSHSINFRIARALGKVISYRYAMTGTPFHDNPEALWSQFFAVDGGETLGPTLGLLRQAYFIQRENHWSSYGEWIFPKKNSKKLARVMRHRSIRYSEDECLDLPDRVDRVVKVVGDAETWAYYERLREDLKKAKGRKNLVESIYMQARQVVAGWLKLKDEESGDSQIIRFTKTPKLDALIEVLAEVPETDKVLVFNVYHGSGDLIEKRLKAERIKALRLYGKTRDKPAVLKAFKEGDARVLIVSKSGALGLNLQVANHVIFFESFDSSIDRAQAEKRIRRPGQKKRTHYWDLVMVNTVDERILESVKAGTSLRQDLIDGRADL